MPNRRTRWYAKDFEIKDEPLAKSLIEYRQADNRWPVDDPNFRPNLISSITVTGKQMPILDLDFPHQVIESSTPGHHHLFLDVEMSNFRWFVLMCALRFAGVIELGFFLWSIRRGGNFVRIPGTVKSGDPKENTKPRYGWFFKLREPK